jgi:hypothetical protein
MIGKIMGTFLICQQTGTHLRQVRPRLPAERANQECPHYFPDHLSAISLIMVLVSDCAESQ